MEVRQKQPLFYLPDLSQMEVQVAVNESVVDQVRMGQRVIVTFEALPKLVLTGRVDSVGQIPILQKAERWRMDPLWTPASAFLSASSSSTKSPTGSSPA